MVMLQKSTKVKLNKEFEAVYCYIYEDDKHICSVVAFNEKLTKSIKTSV